MATKKEIANEILTNMDLTKEQYLQFCKLYDELSLEPEEKELSWEELDALTR